MVPVCVVAWDKRQKFATSPAVSLQLILCRESLVTLQVYKSTSHIKVLKSVQSELLTHEVTQPLSEWWSLKVDSLFLPEWFELYYKLTLEKKWLTYTVCCVGSGVNNLSLTVLLVNCQNVTSRIFDRWISRQTGMKSPLQWHNHPGKKIKDFLIESLMTLQNVHCFVGLWVLQCPGDYMSIICFISLVLVCGVSQNNICISTHLFKIL